jgi:hypothetical protein
LRKLLRLILHALLAAFAIQFASNQASSHGVIAAGCSPLKHEVR